MEVHLAVNKCGFVSVYQEIGAHFLNTCMRIGVILNALLISGWCDFKLFVYELYFDIQVYR